MAKPKAKKAKSKAKKAPKAKKNPAKKAKAKPKKKAAKKKATGKPKKKAEPKKSKAKPKKKAAKKKAKADKAKAKPKAKKPAAPKTDKAPAVVESKPKLNNYVVVIFDSCRFDSFMAGKHSTMAKLGEIEKRYSYASWTAPSHYNLMTGLMPHSSPQHVYASEYYKKDFLRYADRLGMEGTSFRDLVPHLWFPKYLKGLGYHTHARVSMPVLNSRTGINVGFDTYRLMDKHNDMRSMFETMRFSKEKPNFFLLNVGETHYPYALPSEKENDLPRISGVHGVFKKLDDNIKDGKVVEGTDKFFDDDMMKMLKQRQIDAVSYLDTVVEELFDLVPDNTYITLTADHGELFGEGGYFGHGPINHDKVFEVPFMEGKLR